MAKFEITADIRILHDGKPYKKGDILEIDDDKAHFLGAYGKRLEKVVTQKVDGTPEETQVITPEAQDSIKAPVRKRKVSE